MLARPLLLIALFLAFLAPQTGAYAQSAGRSLTDAARAYEGGDFSRSAALARLVGDRSTGIEREAARYLEGIALFRSGLLDKAVSPLRIATASKDRFIASQSNITLGSLEIERKRYDAAGHAYRRAAELLDGAESRRAHSYAARCFDSAGLGSLAEAERVAAGEPRVLAGTPTRERGDAPVEASEAAPRRVTLDDKPPVAPPVNNIAARRNVAGTGASIGSSGARVEATPRRFAVQIGAFTSIERANLVASELRTKCSALDVDAPRVVTREAKDGSSLHIVQIGCFPDRGAANKVLQKFPRSGYRVESYCEAVIVGQNAPD